MKNNIDNLPLDVEYVDALYAKCYMLRNKYSIETSDGERTKDSDGNDRISCYCYKMTDDGPMMSIRISNHNPILSNYKLDKTHYDEISSLANTNISIEFIHPDEKFKREKKKNINDFINDSKYFTVDAFLYDAEKLTKDDIDLIYKSIEKWLSNNSKQLKPFVDPFMNSYKQAYKKSGYAIKIETNTKLVPDDKKEMSIGKSLVVNPMMTTIDFTNPLKEYIFITYDKTDVLNESLDAEVKKLMIMTYLYDNMKQMFEEVLNKF